MKQILYIFALRTGKITIFERKVVIFTARQTNIYKICQLQRAIFSSFYNISQPNFAILLIVTFLAVVMDFVVPA